MMPLFILGHKKKKMAAVNDIIFSTYSAELILEPGRSLLFSRKTIKVHQDSHSSLADLQTFNFNSTLG